MKGLTLIELMISIALLIITLSVGVPGFSSLIERYESSFAITSLKRIFIKSRSIALERETTVTTCPTHKNRCINNWNSPITIFADLNKNQIIDLDEPKYLTTQIDAQSGYWQKKRINTPLVRFNPQGHAFSTATTFLFCPYSSHTSYAKQLIINFQGRIRTKNYLDHNRAPYRNIAPLTCKNSE